MYLLIIIGWFIQSKPATKCAFLLGEGGGVISFEGWGTNWPKVISTTAIIIRGFPNCITAMISSKRALKRENRRPPASVSPHPASLREDSTRILHRSWAFKNIGKVQIFGIQPQYFPIQHPKENIRLEYCTAGYRHLKIICSPCLYRSASSVEP